MEVFCVGKKDTAVTIRLTKEIADKFKAISQQKDVSQAEFLTELIEGYDEKINLEYREPVISKGGKIEILLAYENLFLEDVEKQIKIPKKYQFEGEYKYWTQPPVQLLPAKNYKDELGSEFKIKEENLEECEFYYYFAIAEHTNNEDNKKKYVIAETFTLVDEEDAMHKLYVNRCKFANSLVQITQHIKKYALIRDIRNVEYILADVIENEEDVENFFRDN